MPIDLAIISQLFAETAMQVLATVVFATGIIRGFSGFGAGMIIGPVGAAFFGPKMILAMITIIDVIPSLVLAKNSYKNVNWRELIPVVIGYALLAPLGVWVLKTGDPTALRWFICASIFVAISVLWSGWKYKGPRSQKVSFGIGTLGGFMGTAAALPGPPVLIYWLAGAAKAIEVRANMIWYLLTTEAFVVIGYIVGDIYTVDAIIRGVFLTPFYLLGLVIGVTLFKGASEQLYRRVAFTIILIAAISSIPLLDSILRG